jgi:hypothetical protein
MSERLAMADVKKAGSPAGKPKVVKADVEEAPKSFLPEAEPQPTVVETVKDVGKKAVDSPWEPAVVPSGTLTDSFQISVVEDVYGRVLVGIASAGWVGPAPLRILPGAVDELIDALRSLGK